ncbi:hypothetical protein NPIL_427071 [Nephila pilipes]|uniref:Uncharacterized protein n=1 Tax=Nephila pilipes TaxID=299642 RepID=A0A8X6QB47_NEPPI|nr:hypothetical protein NPIL_427071 [Nephila pilipes]
MNDLRRQIGTLNFTRSSPEIQKICDEYYNEIKKDVIAEHGYSGWSSVWHEVHREVIEPKIPGEDSEEVNLEGTCSWVPASFRHDVEGGHSRTVYGGVCIAGMANRIIDRKLGKALARQTREEGKQAIENNIRGTALNRVCEKYLTKLLSSDPRFKVESNYYVSTDLGRRYLDLVVLKDGIPVQDIEIKAANSPYTRPNSFEAEIENKKPTKER